MGLNIFLTGLIVFVLMLIVAATDKKMRTEPDKPFFRSEIVAVLAWSTVISVAAMVFGLITMVWS
ncbi:MAG TPA: hypothetical protein VIC08_00775 [Cellvibrionaceae bacterium]